MAMETPNRLDRIERVLEAIRVAHAGPADAQEHAYGDLSDDLPGHCTALRRLFSRMPTDAHETDRLALRKLGRILETEVPEHVRRFGPTRSSEPSFEYAVWQRGVHEQLAELYSAVCLDHAAIDLAIALGYQDVPAQRRHTALCNEKPERRAMFLLHQPLRRRSERQPDDAGWFRPKKQAPLWRQEASTITTRVSEVKRRLRIAEKNVDAPIVQQPSTFLPVDPETGKHVYSSALWQPLERQKKA